MFEEIVAVYGVWPKVVEKPWGWEEWIALNPSYCLKRIHIRAGQKTSYQLHHKKRETNFFLEGEAEVWLDDERGDKQIYHMKAGDRFDVLPPRRHRIIAKTDLLILEASSPEVDDVVRLEDDTNRPSGRIESEHNKGQS